MPKPTAHTPQTIFSKLYVVATPIGNLGDMTLRAIETLRTVDYIAVEDTRHSRHLLAHFAIQKPLCVLHQHNESTASQAIIVLLQAGHSVALITDAGTPAISDPGALLVRKVREAGIAVVTVPGASAVIAALAIAGIAPAPFLFYGFLPATTTHRRKALTNLLSYDATLVFYEAPHRLCASLQDMCTVLGGSRVIILARELTKTFETVYRTTLAEALADVNHTPPRGEYVLLLEPQAEQASATMPSHVLQTLQLLLHELPLNQAVRLTATITAYNKKELYACALRLKPSL